jgi:hypothetical protein
MQNIINQHLFYIIIIFEKNVEFQQQIICDKKKKNNFYELICGKYCGSID